MKNYLKISGLLFMVIILCSLQSLGCDMDSVALKGFFQRHHIRPSFPVYLFAIGQNDCAKCHLAVSALRQDSNAFQGQKYYTGIHVRSKELNYFIKSQLHFSQLNDEQIIDDPDFLKDLHLLTSSIIKISSFSNYNVYNFYDYLDKVRQKDLEVIKLDSTDLQEKMYFLGSDIQYEGIGNSTLLILSKDHDYFLVYDARTGMLRRNLKFEEDSGFMRHYVNKFYHSKKEYEFAKQTLKEQGLPLMELHSFFIKENAVYISAGTSIAIDNPKEVSIYRQDFIIKTDTAMNYEDSYLLIRKDTSLTENFAARFCMPDDSSFVFQVEERREKHYLVKYHLDKKAIRFDHVLQEARFPAYFRDRNLGYMYSEFYFSHGNISRSAGFFRFIPQLYDLKTKKDLLLADSSYRKTYFTTDLNKLGSSVSNYTVDDVILGDHSCAVLAVENCIQNCLSKLILFDVNGSKSAEYIFPSRKSFNEYYSFAAGNMIYNIVISNEKSSLVRYQYQLRK